MDWQPAGLVDMKPNYVVENVGATEAEVASSRRRGVGRDTGKVVNDLSPSVCSAAHVYQGVGVKFFLQNTNILWDTVEVGK